MAVTAAALDLSCFAYLALPQKLDGTPRLMSTYPKEWTSHYLRSHYERIDPVIMQALRDTEPFRWGIGSTERYLSPAQKRLLDEASQYGIRLGFTVPIHDGHGPVAAVTFAGNQREAQFERFVTSNPRMLQLMAMFFHSHVRRKLASNFVRPRVRMSGVGRPRQERLGHRTHSGNIASHCYLLPEQRESKIGSANRCSSGTTRGRCQTRTAKLRRTPPTTRGDAS